MIELLAAAGLIGLTAAGFLFALYLWLERRPLLASGAVLATGIALASLLNLVT